MRSRFACLLPGLLLAGGALAADGLIDAPGAVAPVGFDIQGSPLPKAQVPALRGRLERLLGQLRGTPALAPLRGFAINQSARLFEQPAALAGAPSGGWAHLLVRRIDPARSERDPSGAWRGLGEGPAIELRVNDQAALFGYGVGKDALGDYYQLAVKPRRLQGMPVLQIGSKDVVVVHKPGRKPFAHISRQRYLEGLIAGEHAHIALLQKQLAEATDAESRHQLEQFIHQWQGSVAQKQASLNGMSEAERRSPTCQSSGSRGLFAACGEPGAVYYVTFAPDYFQPGLPPSSVQLLTISVVNKGFLNDRVLGLKLREAVAQLDLPALQRSLD
ncbi:hypothetical protein [Pseudomonas subflava]|uniref:hypothetical protein n=1 Tax=Pseudomonas subflava TaxID=2952933 RepID=UPI00207AB7C8|nr:hypothetical protein [Pseudomonas subflava]